MRCSSSSSGKLDFTRLTVIVLWAGLAVVQVQRLSANSVPCESTEDDCRLTHPAPGCTCNQFLNATSGVCTDCVRCCDRRQLELSPCLQERDAVCSQCVVGKQFFDVVTSRCRNCTVCKADEQRVAECSASEDAQCRPRCQPHQFYVEEEDRCQMRCALCEHGCVTSGAARCRCQPSDCYTDTDILCEINLCTVTEETTQGATGSVDGDSNDLPTWGIGLISIGVVIGIVAFSAGSMILSFCTRRATQNDGEEEEEEGVGGGAGAGRGRRKRQSSESKPDLMGRYVNNGQPPGPFLCPSHYSHHHHHHIDCHRKYGGYSPTSSRTNSLRSGSLRSNGIRSSPKAVRVIPSPRTENATPI